MNEQAWEEEARELARQHRSRIRPEMRRGAAAGYGLPSLKALRRALIEADRLLRKAPAPVRKRYRELDERKLREASVKAMDMFDSGELAWPALQDIDIVMAAAVQVRALDAYLLRHTDVRGPLSDGASGFERFLCETNQIYVIPRLKAEPPEVAEIKTKTYQRRGLFWHRLLPKEIDGYTITPYWFRDLSLPFREEQSKVASAVFANLSLTRRDDFKGFVAKDAPCVDEEALLAAQLEAQREARGENAYKEGVLAAVWPELTMPPNRRARLARFLRAKAKDCPPGKGPRFIAAGSWHEVGKDGKTVCNRMHILSNMGETRFHYDKKLRLESEKLGMEQDLDPSIEIPVLVTEDALISFAICRDFCDAEAPELYLRLDVDLMIVPSYGDKATIHAHCDQAKAFSILSGTRTFVVQQAVAEKAVDHRPLHAIPSSTGYVCPPNDVEVDREDKRFVTITPPGAVHPIAFKRV